MLTHHHLGQYRGKNAPIMEFVGAVAAKIHRGTRVQENLAMQIGVVLKLFNVEFIGARPDLPIDVAQVVALGVGAVSRKFSAVAQKRAAMKTSDEAFND